jgi:hypothetical protein
MQFCGHDGQAPVIGPKSRFAPQKPQFPKKDLQKDPMGKGAGSHPNGLFLGTFTVQTIITLYIRGLASTPSFLESRMITISLIRGQALVPVARYPTASFAPPR